MIPADDSLDDQSSWEKILYSYRIPITVVLIGLIMIGVSYLFYKEEQKNNDEIQVVENKEEEDVNKLFVEVAGAVEKPGVYSFEANSRIEDALTVAGGPSSEADSEWVEKNINRASRLTDGQKIYIVSLNEQTDVLSAKEDGGYQTISSENSTNLGAKININTASQGELESLWGIGPVYAQNIIDQRPYSNTEELLNKKIIKSNVYERVKDQITVY